MKRVRITYPGAFHHAMNRGYDGNDIFAGNKNKAQKGVRQGVKGGSLFLVLKNEGNKRHSYRSL